MKIICIGDSLTYGYKVARRNAWPSLLSEMTGRVVVNSGINGDTTSGVLGRFQKCVVEQLPTHAVIMAGTNDFIWDVPLSLIKANISALIQHSLYYRIIPILGVPIPICIEQAKKYWGSEIGFEEVNYSLANYREWLLQYCSGFNITVLDFYKEFIRDNGKDIMEELYLDGLHPTNDGHKVMAELCRMEL